MIVFPNTITKEEFLVNYETLEASEGEEAMRFGPICPFIWLLFKIFMVGQPN